MNTQFQIPVASTALTPLGAGAVCPPTAADGGAAANLSDLPCWARNDEARALLARIAEAQPDRTKPLTETMTGATASFGYRGKEAARLRQMFDPFIMERIGWAYQAGFDTPLFHKRRAAVFAYIDVNGPDALITRVLDRPAGQWAHAA